MMPHQQLFKPHPALREFVSGILIFRADLRHFETNVICPFPPTPQNYIYFYLNDPLCVQKNGQKDFIKKPVSITVGPQLTRVNLSVGKDHFMLGVIFHPGGLYRLLGFPMGKIYDEDVDSYALFGNAITIIYERLKGAQSWLEMKNIVEAFLLFKIERLKAALPFDYAIRELVNNSGSMRIEKVASLSCLSIRQFERKCLERIGMPPKLFARLIRFSNAYRLKEEQPHLTWTAIAHSSGYFDQMHFLKDFKEFAGITPTLIQEGLEETPLRLQGSLRH